MGHIQRCGKPVWKTLAYLADPPKPDPSPRTQSDGTAEFLSLRKGVEAGEPYPLLCWVALTASHLRCSLRVCWLQTVTHRSSAWGHS